MYQQIVLLSLFFCSVVTPQLAIGYYVQEEAASPAPQQDHSSDSAMIRVYTLKHQDAQAATKNLLAIFSSRQDTTRFTADPRTNSLIVAADSKTHQIVQSLLEQLDRQKPTEDTASEIIKLDYDLDRNQYQVLSAWARMENVQLATEPETRLILIKGNQNPDITKRLNQLLDTLKTSAPETKSVVQPYLVRLFWLREGAQRESDNELVQRVSRQVKLLGVKGLSLASELACRCDMNPDGPTSFSAAVSPKGDEVPAIKLDGSLRATEADEKIQGEIVIQVGSEQHNLMQFQVDASLTPGKYVVLAAGPYQGAGSVFVLQLLPSESE